MDQICVDGYTVIKRISSSGFSDVFLVQRTDSYFIMKTEQYESDTLVLSNEVNILNSLPDTCCFPKIVCSGNGPAFSYFVLPLYGPSLADVVTVFRCSRIPAPTATKLFHKMLAAVNALHEIGCVHCDIKPSNFLIYKNHLILIDYGLSYIKEPQFKDQFIGTLTYASENVQRLNLPRKRDDFISCFYSAIYLLQGSLPWSDLQDPHMVLVSKQTTSISKLCSGLPDFIKEIGTILNESCDIDGNRLLQIVESEIERKRWNTLPYEWETDPSLLDRFRLEPHFSEPKKKRSWRSRFCL